MIGMTQFPFIVVCTSCESILEVRNPGLVGQIVACPNCGSMVLIEPTSQSRERLRVSDFRLQEESVNANPEVIPSESRHCATLHSGFCEVPDIAETGIAEPNVVLSDIDEQLSPLATELQAKFLNDIERDTWQKRRLVLVAVGTTCLLTVFAVFLLLRLQAKDATPEVRSPKSEVIPVKPPVPDGIETTRSGGQPGQPSDNLQSVITPLSTADEIKVEGQIAPDDSRPNESDDQDNMAKNAVEPAPSALLRPSHSIPDQPGRAVHVPATLSEIADDPFDDIDNNPIDNNPEPDSSEDELNDDRMSDETIDDSNDVTGGFADFVDTDVSSPADTSTPDHKETTEPDDDEITDDEIDIDERLSRVVASIDFAKTPILVVVRVLSDISGVPMQLDIDELRARGISVEAPITLQVQESTVAGVIDAVMQKTKLTRHDGNGYLVLGYSAEQVGVLRTARYDMSRLAMLEQNPISAEQAAGWLTELLVDQSHNPKVTNAAVAVDGHEIVVVGTPWLQDQAKRLLLSLYYLRDLEPENGPAPERLAPEVFGWDRVNAALSFNLVEPISLKKAARLIEGHTKLRVLIDHAALHNEGFSQETPITSRISHGTIDTVLRGMLEPSGLTYRIVEENVVEITTLRVARDKMTIEAHRFTPLTDDQTLESCAETMRQAFGGDASWNPGTGDVNDTGVIVIDSVSGYILVRQSQPLQHDIRLWFGRMQSEPQR